MKRTPLLTRFHAKFTPCEHAPLCLYCCWLWTGKPDRDGYGFINLGGDGGQRVRAHRFSWELHNAKCIPPGLLVCHYCHTPSCVNPLHLHVGTHKDNFADSIRDGLWQCGEGNHRSKLTEAQVRDIYAAARNGIKVASIAATFGVHKDHVYLILRGKRWGHIKKQRGA